MRGGAVLTSWLDLVGALLLVVAFAALVWPVSVAGALACAGVAVLVLSWLIDRAKRKGDS